MKKRVGVYLPEKKYQELLYLSEKYGHSCGYILRVAFHISDLNSLEKVLSLNLEQ